MYFENGQGFVRWCSQACRGIEGQRCLSDLLFYSSILFLVWWNTEHLHSKHQQLWLDKSHFTLEKAQAQAMCPFTSQSDAEAEPIVHFALNFRRHNK